MQQSLLTKVAGLFTYTNYISEVPPGALVKADNVVINRDGIIESRRGLAVYGTSFGLDSDRANQLLSYKGRIIRHYATTLQFDSDGAGNFVSFSGSFSATEDKLRIKAIEANGNFLFTTAEGIKKISVTQAADIAAGSVIDSGAPKAITIRGAANTGTPGFLSTTSKVAYRVVWGYKDNNNNLILGSPSTRIVVENTDPVNTAVVDLEILIPDGVNEAYFYQLYRSAVVASATEPDDELNLVLEANPSTAEISAGTLSVTDITPDDFRAGGVLLYTNPNSGEGINQANDPPPLAKDIALFKNHAFYANTSTRHRLFLNLLSVTAFTNGISDLVISDGTTTETYTFDVAENAATKTVLLSASPSVAIAVDETARSLEYVINKQSNGLVYAYYISGPTDVPGALLLERRDLSDAPFYLGTTDSAITEKWNPVLPEIIGISAIGTGGSPSVTTAAAHGLATGDEVVLYGTDSTPVLDKKATVTVTGASTFTVPASPPITVAGTTGFMLPTENASDNEVAPNRLYFSKLQQYEAVPIVNFLDLGPKDEPIKRIIALRDSLFVLKTDGVYRITGESSTSFTSFLFDGSTAIFAPDSAAVLNNQIYVFTNQGVATISDTGIAIISRPIEDKILKLVTPQYVNSASASFGVGYEYDNSYIVWTVSNFDDDYATQAFRFNVFTKTWTRWTTGKTCGMINVSGDNKLYVGANDDNVIERERKDLSRYDYADRQLLETIPPNAIDGTTINIGSTADFAVGDVILQTQYVTIAQFNRLLRKLDNDPELDGGFYSSFAMSPGDSLSTSLTNLVAELNVQDTSTVYAFTGSSDPATIQAEYNVIIGQLNASTGVFYVNYETSTGTVIYDAIVTAVDNVAVTLTINYEIPFVEGDCYVYKAYQKTVEWAPILLGDPSVLKQVSESTFLFENTGFYGASVAYATDLSKNFETIDFLNMGNGQFGSFVFGEHTFGGEGTQIPLRTYVPQQKQRCRWINPRFIHKNALENPALFGVSFTFDVTSQRGYR